MNIDLRCRNGWYYAVIKKQRGLGRALVRRLGTQSLAEAQELAKLADLDKMALAEKANAIGLDVWTRLLAGRKVTCQDALEGYLEHRLHVGLGLAGIKRAEYNMAKFFRFTGLGPQSIAAIQPSHVGSFINDEADRGKLKFASRKYRLIILSVFLDWCVEKRWLVSNPAAEVRVRIEGLTQEQLMTKAHATFTDEEVSLLLSKIPRMDFWHGAILLGNTYGLRIGSVVALEWGNVVGNQLRLYTTKGKRMVNERLSDELIGWLEEWKAARPASDLPYVFPAQAAAGSNLCSENFSMLVKRHGIQGKTFAGFRKAATARVWNATLDQLGDHHSRLLARLVMENGYRKVQEMLAHAPGSDVTDKHYLPKSPKPE